MKKKKQKQIRAIAKDVTHYYTDPVTGERKSIYIGDGPIDEVNQKIMNFMQKLKELSSEELEKWIEDNGYNTENKTESDAK